MGNVSDKTVARISKLFIGVQKNIFNDKKNGEEQGIVFANVLQAVLEKRKIHIGSAVKVVDLSLIPSTEDQIKKWEEANEKGNLSIPEEAFENISGAPELTEEDKKDGFVGAMLRYGFGDDGKGNADPLESGRISWIIAERVHEKTWKSDYVKFKKRRMRLRPEVKPRPKGFSWIKVHLGQNYQSKSVKDARKMFPEGDTGMAFEGIQLLAVIIPEYASQMNGRDKPYLDLADYDVDVALDSDSGFYGAPYLFVNDHELRLSIAGVGHAPSKFGLGVLR